MSASTDLTAYDVNLRALQALTSGLASSPPLSSLSSASGKAQLAAAAAIDSCTSVGLTWLHLAAALGCNVTLSPEDLPLLVSEEPRTLSTPLHYSVLLGQESCVAEWLEVASAAGTAEASPMSMFEALFTKATAPLLHFAVFQRQTGIVGIILASLKKQDRKVAASVLKATDARGLTAGQLAWLLGNKPLADLLQAAEAECGEAAAAEAVASRSALGPLKQRPDTRPLPEALPFDHWQLHLYLGSIGTIPGTCSGPVLTLAGKAAPHGQAPLAPTSAATVTMQLAQPSPVYTATVLLRQQKSGGSWCSRDATDALSTAETAVEVEGERASSSSRKRQLLPYESLVFSAPFLHDFTLLCKITVGEQQQEQQEAYCAAVTADMLVGSVAGVAAGAGAASTTVGVNASQLRTSGQLLLPLHKLRGASEGAGGAAAVAASHSLTSFLPAGQLSLRYQLIRGYAMPKEAAEVLLQGVQGSVDERAQAAASALALSPASTVTLHSPANSVASSSSSSSSFDAAVAGASVPSAAVTASTSEAAPAAGAAAGGQKVVAAATPLCSSPTASASYWKTTRLGGHRGSGADNAAVVKLQQDAPAAVALATASAVAATQVVGAGAAAGAAFPAAGSSSVERRLHKTHILENTALSLQEAGKAGAEFVEFDVQISKDGVPIIHHDWTVKMGPAADGVRVPVTSLTAAQFLSLAPQSYASPPGKDETSLAREAEGKLMQAVQLEGRGKSSGKRVAPLAGGVAGSLPLTPLAAGPASVSAGHSSSSESDSRALQSYGIIADQRHHSSGSSRPSSPLAGRAGSTHSHLQSSKDRDSLQLQTEFCTLQHLLETVPEHVGFNVEVKYPTEEESYLFGLRPLERNAYAERILDVIFTVEARKRRASKGKGETGAQGLFHRPLFFSSFDPDTCLAFARKQAVYPVLLLTEGGTPSVPYFDPRWNSLYAASCFARAAGLFGIVTDVTPLLAAPQLIPLLQQGKGGAGAVAGAEKEGGEGLILCSYGRANNNPAKVQLQVDWGMAGVIVDHVATIHGSLKKAAPAAVAGAAVAGGGGAF